MSRLEGTRAARGKDASRPSRVGFYLFPLFSHIGDWGRDYDRQGRSSAREKRLYKKTPPPSLRQQDDGYTIIHILQAKTTPERVAICCKQQAEFVAHR